MATELRTRGQAERQPLSPGSVRGINKQSGRHVRQLILSQDMIPFIIPHSGCNAYYPPLGSHLSSEALGEGKCVFWGSRQHKHFRHETLWISRLPSHPGEASHPGHLLDSEACSIKPEFCIETVMQSQQRQRRWHRHPLCRDKPVRSREPEQRLN